MLLNIPDVLTPEQAAHCRRLLEAADWVDGRGTAGHLSHGVKDNQQLRFDNPVAVELGELITRRLETHPLFMSAALPSKIVPPLFNRYAEGQRYGDHVDGAIRPIDGTPHRVRTDLSATLFLSEPSDYDGGDLVIEEPIGPRRVRLPAGHLLLYPSSSIHRIEPVTRGAAGLVLLGPEPGARRRRPGGAVRTRQHPAHPAARDGAGEAGPAQPDGRLPQPAEAVGGRLIRLI